MKRPVPFHPPLFAAYPVLSLYAANVVLINWRSVLVPTILSIAAVSVLWLLLGFALRDIQRAAAASSMFLLSFFTFDLLSNVWTQAILGQLTVIHRAPFWLWGSNTLALVVMAAWKARFTPHLTLFFNFVSMILVAFSIGSIVKSHWEISKEVSERTSTFARANSIANRRPDVYYIILDGYGRTDVFERIYGFSDANFVAALEQSGFYVARDARTNYCQTELSFASSLNMAPVQHLVQPGGNVSRIRAVLDSQIDDSSVAREFKAHGYLYVAVTTGFPALHFDSADVKMERDSGATLFWSALLEKTPLRSTSLQESGFVERRRFLQSAFAELKELARPSAIPRFVVVHILAPHPPFVFGPNGEALRPKGPFGFWDGSHYNEVAGTDEDYQRGYTGQAEFVAKTLIDTLTAFKQGGASDPIVLIQGDHGPKSKLDQGSLERTDINEVFPILSAYLVPDDIRSRLYSGISPINSFRIILSSLFGDELPLLPDRSFYSTWEAPTDFTDVTSRIAPRSAGTKGNLERLSNPAIRIPGG